MAVINERFEAIVASTDDPEKRGRIKATCADFTGDPDAVLPDFIEPVFDWGWFYTPDVGEIVEIEVVTNDDTDEMPGASMILSPTIHWRNKRFYHTGDEDPRPINEQFTSSNYGKRRGFATPAGHVIMFDDTPGSEKVLITDKTGNVIEMKSAGLVIRSPSSIVYLGEGAEASGQPVIRGTDWQTWEVAHTHPDPLSGFTGPPVQPIPPTVLSSTTKVK